MQTQINPLHIKWTNTLSLFLIDTMAAARTVAIIDTYTAEQGLRDLMQACDIRQNALDKIITDGFRSMDDLVNQYESDINDFSSYLKSINKAFGNATSRAARIYFSPPMMSRFIGALFYCNVCYYNLHLVPDISLITEDFAMENYKLRHELTSSESQNLENDIEIKIPVLKGASNWRAFRDSFEMKLGITKSRTGFPITYVIDQTERGYTRSNANRGITENIDLSDENIFKEKAVHFGKTFKEDNKTVWLHLKSALLRTPTYDHISEYNQTSNGRQAWITLKNFYEGEDFMQRLQDEAFIILKNTMYRGESAKHRFENYVNRHIKAHKLLVEAGYNDNKGMDNSTKIQHLKSGIKFEAGLEHALTTSRTSGLLRGTFAEFASFLQAEVDGKQDRKRELKSNVNVSKNNTQRNGKKPSVPSETVEGKRVEGRSYSSNEWKKLTPAQRKAVCRLQRASKPSNVKKERSYNSRNLSKTDVSSISEAIISGMINGKSEKGDNTDEVSNVTDDGNTSTNKRKAPPGGAGEFLMKRK